MQAKHAKESCSKSIRRRVLTGLERLPVIRIIVDHLGKEGMAPHADLLLLSPHTKPHSHATIIHGPTTNIHAYPASHLCRRATAHRLDLVSALLPSQSLSPSSGAAQQARQYGSHVAGFQRQYKSSQQGDQQTPNARHVSDIQGRLVPQLCDPGKALTLGWFNCEC